MSLQVVRRKSSGALTIDGIVNGKRVQRRASSDDWRLAEEEAFIIEARLRSGVRLGPWKSRGRHGIIVNLNQLPQLTTVCSVKPLPAVLDIDILHEHATCVLPKTRRGVYFLFQGRAIQYIGRSTTVVQRVAAHDGRIPFDRWAFLPVDGNERALHTIEVSYIQAYWPPYNKVLA